MEHDLWVEVIKQVPALGVLVFLIIKFLSFLTEQRQAETARTECVSKALEKNTELYGRVIECLNQNSRALDDYHQHPEGRS